jgi:hypothetical protein
MTRIGMLVLGTLGLGLLIPQDGNQALPLPPATPTTAETSVVFPPGTVFAVDATNQLRHFPLDAPTAGIITGPITGLQPAEVILGLDFRPATGRLYGLGSTSRLYVINYVTAAASPVGGPFSPPLSGNHFGFDFDPTTDRIRVVSDLEQNLRLDPDTGAVVVDSPINPAVTLVALAYGNNFAGATTTTLYGIDSSADQLVIQNPPNSGQLTPVGPLGFDTNEAVTFDIAPGGVAYAALTSPIGMTSGFYRINLTTGQATQVDPISPQAVIRGLAILTGPETVFAVTTGNNLLRFDSHTPGAIISKSPITGLQPGETVVGMDFRPADGRLYAVGDTSRIYRIDPADGVATQVGPTPSPFLMGSAFGVDFNPQTDRLRVVSDLEQNLRIDLRTGSLSIDLALNPPGNVVAAAYSNNFAGPPATTLYDIDSNTDLLLIQNPPNNGTLSAVGPLNVDTSALTGFDIAPDGMAFASLTLPAAATSGFYSIDLATGAATLIGAIGAGETIRDITVRVLTEVIHATTQTPGTHSLISFNAAAPGQLLSSVAITGLQPSEALTGIDFRPATGQLFGIGGSSRVYRIDPDTGVATAVGPQFTPLLSGVTFGVDFNPTTDRIRVVSSAEQNLRIDPNTGLVQNVDTPLTLPLTVAGAAYSNNAAGVTTTRLYDVDTAADQLLVQDPPNNGVLTPVGALGVGDLDQFIGFDIAGIGTAYLSGYVLPAIQPSLFRVNLRTGAATLVGVIDTTGTLTGLAVAPVSVTSGTDTPAAYVPSSGVWFLRNANSAGAADLAFKFGAGGANLVPIKGDWDGDGDDTPGVYDRTTGRFSLRNSSSAGPAEVPPFPFGPGGAGFLPIAGDWDGDGTDTVGLYDPATGVFFLKNTNAAGAADVVFVFGGGGGLPIAGDWNNDNTDTIGVYVPATAAFFLRNSNSAGPADIAPFTFGPPGLRPVAGDWNGDGTDTVGVFNPATAAWFLANGFTGGPASLAFVYGPPGAVALVGDWNAR